MRTVRRAVPDSKVGDVREVEDVLCAVRGHDWAQWDSPWADHLWAYDPSAVAPAFDALVGVESDAAARTVYHRLLNALGHDHSGTPYPAIVDGVRALVALVPFLTSWAAAAAVSTLVECYLFTQGASDLQTVDGRVHDLTVVHGLVATLEPHLKRVAADGSHEASRAAADLRGVMADLPPVPRG